MIENRKDHPDEPLQPVPMLSMLNREVLGLVGGCSLDMHGNADPASLAFEMDRLGYGPLRDRVSRRLILERRVLMSEKTPPPPPAEEAEG